MDSTRDRETHDAGVVNYNHDNRQCAKQIQARLTFTILKSWINGCRRQ